MCHIFTSRTLEVAHLEDGPLDADLLPQLTLVGEGQVGRGPGGRAHRGEDLGAGLDSVAVRF